MSRSLKDDGNKKNEGVQSYEFFDGNVFEKGKRNVLEEIRSKQ